MPVAAVLATNAEPISGYKLVERIGAGGYGEVWKAEAPGGLYKAIKFVYGQLDEQRATAELGALKKMKSVRHPFLLSLERIEVVDGQLVIVTELGDDNVQDRFHSFLDSGHPGIPRDELLAYMRDTADALDHLRDKYHLQHLDIKPENLLLVAGHIKVADFGLVKGLGGSNNSLMGGLTPQYAAPEIFHGKPSEHSDQYSLAVLYKELLTGSLPFSGQSAAELTRQHLTEEPDLSFLPHGDSEVIARAMSKQPERRYASCGEMVKALMSAGQASSMAVAAFEQSVHSQTDPQHNADGSASSQGTRPTVDRRPSKTIVLEETSLPSDMEAQEQRSIHLSDSPAGTITQLPPLQLDTNEFDAYPTLFLGVGGTAGRVFRHLRRRINDRFGDGTKLPAVGMLLLDTDSTALMQATHGDPREVLQSHETLALPLKKTQDYGNSSKDFLKWLNRRWLYNIPKSRKTEGLRPLGRLALMDHGLQTFQRIRQALLNTLADEAVEATSSFTNLPFTADRARICIVGSISGGTASGMLLDVAYAVHSILAKLQLTTVDVNALLTHSTGRKSGSRELAIVNAFSFLSELNHFNRPECVYPGDSTCGLPPAAPGKKPFSNVYLSHLGDNLSEDDLDWETQQVAEYAYLNAFTPAGAFLDASRQRGIKPGSQQQLRAFGLRRISCTNDQLVDAAVDRLCSHVIYGWMGMQVSAEQSKLKRKDEPREASLNKRLLDRRVTEQVVRFQLNSENLTKVVERQITTEIGGDVDSLFAELVAEFQTSHIGRDDPASRGRLLVEAIHNVFNMNEMGRLKESDYPAVYDRSLEARLKRVAAQVTGEIRRWLLRQIDDPLARIHGTEYLIEKLQEQFDTLESEAKETIHCIAEELEAFLFKVRETDEPAPVAKKSAKSPTDRLAAASSRDTLHMYFRLAVKRLTAQGVLRLVGCLSAANSVVLEQQMELRRALKQMLRLFEHDSGPEPKTCADEQDSGDLFDNLWKLADVSLRNRQAELCLLVDQSVQEGFIQKNGGLFQTIAQRGELRDALVDVMKEVSRRAVIDAVQNVDVVQSMLNACNEPQEVGDLLMQSFEDTTPPLLASGGGQRKLLVVPCGSKRGDDMTRLCADIDPSVSVVVNSERDLIICTEAENISIKHVAVALIDNRQDYADFAGRIHARTDVNWTPLMDA